MGTSRVLDLTDRYQPSDSGVNLKTLNFTGQNNLWAIRVNLFE
jgi:hypothetical protein